MHERERERERVSVKLTQKNLKAQICETLCQNTSETEVYCLDKYPATDVQLNKQVRSIHFNTIKIMPGSP